MALLCATVGSHAALACTPAPCIDAVPNPVLLAAGETSGPTSVDWDAGPDIGQASVTVEVDSVESNISTQLVGQTTRTIELGKEYLFRLKDGTGTEVASVKVEAKRRIVLRPARPGITINPIRIFVEEHGTFMNFQIESDDPRNLTLFALSAEPDDCAYNDADIVSVTATGTSNYRTSFSTALYDLEPGTNYFILAKMRDSSGTPRCNHGVYRTLSRLSTITIGSVHVIDDSDDLSAGDLKFGFFINPDYDAKTAPIVGAFPADGETSINSGTGVDFQPDVVLSVPDLAEARFNVSGFDHDGPAWPGTLDSCGRGIYPRSGAFSSECGDSNGREIPLSFAPDRRGEEEITRDFNVRVEGGALEFEVACRLQVTYR